ncbi:hypothetical protein [Halalkalibacter oceani]|uniref:Uncharacterized protein n=1 Tax=Halalkalibacter oceani TaxID=1653776 RepID=A0A9X2DRV9_9BACI|nr:hypothetical protein [Halalkalibacter oceani]MCM3715814.1 hypothetical protein [Halalkalibacter oceani]
MLKKMMNPFRVMLLTPVGLLLAVLVLPVLIATDDVPLLQQFFEYLHQYD